MAVTPIKFGTDGWRAVIADGYTFDNLERVARATARWVLERDETPRVVIGHDTRFQGRAFAERAARVFASEGIEVIFADRFTTTPSISWASKEYGCAAGIVITASHNPPTYNGFKIKSPFGGPASPADIAEVEEHLADVPAEAQQMPSFDELTEEGRIELRDVRGAYLDMIRERIDMAAIEKAGFRVAHDAMFGAGQGMLAELLGADRVVELNCEFNPSFHGQAPEPIEQNTAELGVAVRENACAAGVANDGDADRIGMYDENGAFVDSHKMLSLLVKYLHEQRGLTGEVVKTFSTTKMLDKMCEKYGLSLTTTPIGFKYIGPKMIEGDVLVGGEESGGVGVKGHIPERDGIYIGLLILEMMAERGKSLSELVQELTDEYGPHVYHRADLHLTAERKQSVLDALDQDGLEQLAGQPVRSVDSLDGYKHQLDEGWLLVRPSGTEPVLRIYAEAPTQEQAESYVESMIEQFDLDDSNGH